MKEVKEARVLQAKGTASAEALAGACRVCLRNSEKVSVTGLDSVRERVIGDEFREVTGTKSQGTLS